MMEVLVVIALFVVLFWYLRKDNEKNERPADLSAEAVEEAVEKALRARDMRRVNHFADLTILAKVDWLTLKTLAESSPILSDDQKENWSTIKDRYATAAGRMIEALRLADVEESSTEILLAAAQRYVRRSEMIAIPDGGLAKSVEEAEENLNKLIDRAACDSESLEGVIEGMAVENAAQELAQLRLVKELEDELSFDEEYPQFTL